ncbi:MAG: ACP S-malonyltransferase [Proteobacteria bacterium]|nr:ACP S-malonyltransferase [Pseudomonadota bacterium]
MREQPTFAARFRQVCGLLGFDPLREAADDPSVLRRNAVSSLLTVLASSVTLDAIRGNLNLDNCIGVAGYSVGQWSALYAAGAIDAGQLLDIVHGRATIMDRHMASEPSGMLGIVGVREADLRAVCARARDEGLMLAVANINAPSNYSMSGTVVGLAFAEREVAAFRPKALVRLPVSGGWHSELLNDAVQPFRSLLEKVTFAEPAVRMIDNTTGSWMPAARAATIDRLAAHLSSPVLWKQGVETLAQSGAQIFLEVGLGDILSKFGVFISRKARYIPVLSLQGSAS